MRTLATNIVEIAVLGIAVSLLLAWINHLKTTGSHISSASQRRDRPQFERRNR